MGDDVYAEDPTVNALQEEAARQTGKEAALLVPTGTMGNLCSVLAHCSERGSEARAVLTLLHDCAVPGCYALTPACIRMFPSCELENKLVTCRSYWEANPTSLCTRLAVSLCWEASHSMSCPIQTMASCHWTWWKLL